MAVVIDTSAWIDFFKDKELRSAVAREVDALLDEGRAALTGMILAEVLQGAKDENDVRELEDTLDAALFVETDENAWRMAAKWSYELRRQGMTTPLSDLAIAAAAITGGHSVFATDPHFQRVTGLQLHQPRP